MRKDRAKYRHRRLGALFVVAALSFALYAGSSGAGAEAPTVRYTIAPGETLWEIAVEHTLPGEDPRPKVEAIREANDLSGSTIHPGMTLKVPPAI